MRDGYRENEFFEQYNSSNIDIERKTVLTEHNSRAYQVDGMTNQSPYEIMFKKEDGTEMSVAQYFAQQYNINLDKKQPMLFVNKRQGDRTYLPTQLCHEASLPKNFTKDTFKMRELQKYKIQTAQQRKTKILQLVQQFGLLDRVKIFQEWQMTLEQNMVEVKG